MYLRPMEPYGLALLDYLEEGPDSAITISMIRDDGLIERIPVHSFFLKTDDFSPLEKKALDHCYGSVMDIGAGAGRFSIELQNRGLTVRAIDVSPKACKVMEKLGVKDVHCVNILKYGESENEEKFDTLLLLMKGIGIVENITGLDQFLKLAHKLLNPGGQILLDSLDARFSDNPMYLAYHRANQQEGRYGGELRLQYEYKGKTGPTFRWLLLDRVMLSERSMKQGWDCKFIHKENTGMYLARLTRLQSETAEINL
ncbi:MAG: class I SAM-dependent methyltransferase [Candidatus Odinarchaeota archaeon]